MMAPAGSHRKRESSASIVEAFSGTRQRKEIMHRARRWFLLPILLSSVLLTGCAGVGLTLLGVGAGVAAGTAVSYTLDGIAYRTFTAPLPKVERAALKALDRMGIEVMDKEKTEEGKTIKAAGNDREIEVQLERISAKGTRIRTVVSQGSFFKDRATATEIIIQTEKVLNEAG